MLSFCASSSSNRASDLRSCAKLTPLPMVSIVSPCGNNLSRRSDSNDESVINVARHSALQVGCWVVPDDVHP
eukprot:1524779-Amphidinium_carterae.2